MKGCFDFRFSDEDPKMRDSLVMFFPGDFSTDTVVKVTKADVERNLVPATLYVIVSVAVLEDARLMLADPSVISEVDSLVGDPSVKLRLLCFNGDGEISFSDNQLIIEPGLKARMMSAGMLVIFGKRKGLIVASENFHFLKPSGDHCDGFIRASNLLIAGEEVCFLAMAILPYLRGDLRVIYVDTSSISYLISIAILMSQKFKSNVPTIESFESYAALSQPFDFIEDDSSAVFISATTSGSLAEKLLTQTAFSPAQIVTLFFSRLPDGQLGIFDISGGKNANIRSFKSENCDLCTDGSRLIRIVGDQFLPETPANEQLLIRKVDFSEEREKFFKEFAAKNILKWSVLANSSASSHEHFYIDVEAFLKAPSRAFSTALDAQVNRHFSRHTRTVIYLSDSGSIALTNAIKCRVGEDDSISWLSVDELTTVDLAKSFSVVVVAGAITSGRKLLDVSRRLRVLDAHCSITYFVGFSKLPSELDLTQLDRDLRMGGNQLVVLRRCPMPRITAQTVTAWDIELRELKEWDPSNPFARQGIPQMLLERLDDLKNTSDNRMFLPKLNGESLKLRQTFAFWSSIGVATEAATQADVYWTIQAILHDLRGKVDGGLGSVYHTTVISPTCFDRYNDGIIQAALLRSATPLELNYSVDEQFSQKMTDVIVSVLDSSSSEQGEAALEFLFALSVGRLRLCGNHVRQIIKKFDTEQAGSCLKFYFQKIAHRYGI